MCDILVPHMGPDQIWIIVRNWKSLVFYFIRFLACLFVCLFVCLLACLFLRNWNPFSRYHGYVFRVCLFVCLLLCFVCLFVFVCFLFVLFFITFRCVVPFRGVPTTYMCVLWSQSDLYINYLLGHHSLELKELFATSEINQAIIWTRVISEKMYVLVTWRLAFSFVRVSFTVFLCSARHSKRGPESIFYIQSEDILTKRGQNFSPRFVTMCTVLPLP